jgi:hypothetical protein
MRMVLGYHDSPSHILFKNLEIYQLHETSEGLTLSGDRNETWGSQLAEIQP